MADNNTTYGMLCTTLLGNWCHCYLTHKIDYQKKQWATIPFTCRKERDAYRTTWNANTSLSSKGKARPEQQYRWYRNIFRQFSCHGLANQCKQVGTLVLTPFGGDNIFRTANNTLSWSECRCSLPLWPFRPGTRRIIECLIM